VNLLTRYRRICHASHLDEHRANEIVRAARPHAAAVLAPTIPGADALKVVARCVDAWPIRGEDGDVTIEFVADWGVLLAGWSAAAGPSDDLTLDLDALIGNGERLWVGIANDVLQMYVPDPPAGTYSMVRHHALMLGAATLWLGPDLARQWQRAHALAARAFLRRLGGGSLWGAVASAERGLATLLADPRGRGQPEAVLGWLDEDLAAAATYRDYHGAASLGIVALLATAPDHTDLTGWLRDLVHGEHPDPDFNRDRIEAYARAVGEA
jgi:hypothetical protein